MGRRGCGSGHGADGIVARPMPTARVRRPARPLARRGRRADPLRPRRARTRRGCGSRSSSAPAASPPTCPASARAASAATWTTRFEGSAASSATFVDHLGLERVRAVHARLGRGRAAVGDARARARRAARADRRRAVPARLPLAPLRARVAHGASSARSRWALTNRAGRQAPAARRDGRRGHATPSTRGPSGRSCGCTAARREDALARAGRRTRRAAPRRRWWCGASATRTSRRASPRPTPTRSAARPRSKSRKVRAIGRGASGRKFVSNGHRLSGALASRAAAVRWGRAAFRSSSAVPKPKTEVSDARCRSSGPACPCRRQPGAGRRSCDCSTRPHCAPGLPRLRMTRRLNRVAGSHSRDLAVHAMFSHASSDGTSFGRPHATGDQRPARWARHSWR